ncbi:hypothetical protein [Hyphomicrobium sp. CS1GBMeth3]|uniref:hypothetical protein n=1 Tax=Hyphomicrobium sp. CS1GBMeth3 TaxID=1892845 RepID=UPI00093036AF|nr:hypothetical protein [Hyphomicrobium sp. CS1GBMeth3]
MLDRELTYQMPFERLTKLSRSASRKAFSTPWRLTWLLLGSYFALLTLLVVFDDVIDRLERDAGIPWWFWLSLLVVVLIGGLFLLRRRWRRLIKGRVDFDSAVSFRQDPGGVRFATSQIEYYIKWDGISQMLLEHDGVVISHGSLFFMIPNTAFADEHERSALVRDVFGRLNAAARERSEEFLRPVLDLASAR